MLYTEIISVKHSVELAKYEGHSKSSQSYHVLNSLEHIWTDDSMQLFYRLTITKFSEFIFRFNLSRLHILHLSFHILSPHTL